MKHEQVKQTLFNLRAFALTTKNLPLHKLETLSVIDGILGRDSIEYDYILKINVPSDGEDETKYRQDISDTLRVVNNILNTKKILSKGNFITKTSEGWLMFWFSTIITGAFLFGYWFRNIQAAL